MYTKAAQHTVKLPLVDSLGVALSTAPTITISKDGGAFAAVTNTPTANGSTWNLVLTTAEANCDGYTLYITHGDLAMPVFYQDEATAVIVAALEDDGTVLNKIDQLIADGAFTEEAFPEVDGISMALALKAMLAATAGTTEIDGSDVVFKDRAGTEVLRVTTTAVDGVRSVSVIAGE